MKKVAFIAPTYPVLSETFIQTEVDSVKACGHDVCVMAFEIEESEKSFDYDIIKIGKARILEGYADYYRGLQQNRRAMSYSIRSLALAPQKRTLRHLLGDCKSFLMPAL